MDGRLRLQFADKRDLAVSMMADCSRMDHSARARWYSSSCASIVGHWFTQTKLTSSGWVEPVVTAGQREEHAFG